MITPDFVIRFGVSLIMVAFGLHQMVKPEKWFDYIPEFVHKLSPLKPATEMRLHALGNIVFGIFFFIHVMPKTGGWITLIWWLTILPFAFRKNWAIGMRDLTIILSVVSYLMMVYQG